MNTVRKNNWQTKKLGEVLSIQNGYAFDSKYFSHNKGIPLVRIRDLKDGTNTKINFYGNFDEKYLLHNGDFLIGMDGEFGCYEWNGGKALLNQRVCRLEDFNDLDSKFLFFGINKYLKEIENNTSFTTVKHISSKQIELIEFSYPSSVQEQKRIVKILDGVFEKIEKAKENTKKNLQNSTGLFESYLQNIFKNENIWEEKKVGEVVKIRSSKRIFKNEYVNVGVPFYRTKEIVELESDKPISLELFISEERYKEIKNKFGVPSESDLLLTAIGTIGNVYIVKKRDVFYFKDGNILWLKPSENINSNYLRYALKSYVEILKKLTIGAAYNALTIEKLKNHKIPVPKQDEQQKIVKKLDEISEQTKKIEAIYQQKLADLEELKKSVLQKAFSGEL